MTPKSLTIHLIENDVPYGDDPLEIDVMLSVILTDADLKNLPDTMEKLSEVSAENYGKAHDAFFDDDTKNPLYKEDWDCIGWIEQVKFCVEKAARQLFTHFMKIEECETYDIFIG